MYRTKNYKGNSQRFTCNNLVGAVSSRGEVLITVNEGKTTAQTFLLFIIMIVSHFDELDPDDVLKL